MTVIRGDRETRNGNYGQSGAGVVVSDAVLSYVHGSHGTNLMQIGGGG